MIRRPRRRVVTCFDASGRLSQLLALGLLRIRWRGAGPAEYYQEQEKLRCVRRSTGCEPATPVEVSFLGFARHR
jgi:hypothetical protein